MATAHSRIWQVVALSDHLAEAEFVVQRVLQLRGPSPTTPPTTPPTTIGIIYRTNAHAISFERLLVREGVPYVLAQARSIYA